MTQTNAVSPPQQQTAAARDIKCGRKSITFSKREVPLRFATWNVRTLLLTGNTSQRRTALIGLELNRYNVDIAVLTESRLAGVGSVKEKSCGYTFYWSGLPETERRLHGVCLAIRNDIAKNLPNLPQAVNERLITLQIPIDRENNRHLSIIGVYAPTMTYDDVTKESFYAELDRQIRRVPKEDKLLVMGDFNARVGSCHDLWENVLGPHGLGKCNSNGLLLLSKCSEHELAITNSWFQLPNKHKTTWMHPRSKKWHILDYVLCRKRDLKEIHITKAVRGANGETDHRLLLCKATFKINPRRKKVGAKTQRKLNILALKCAETSLKFRSKLDSALLSGNCAITRDDETLDDQWAKLRDTTFSVAEAVIGFRKGSTCRDWFTDNLCQIEPLIQERNLLHEKWLSTGTRASKRKFCNAQRRLKQETRKFKDAWMIERAQEIQRAADKHDTKKFYDLTKELYGPQKTSSVPITSKDQSALLTDQQERLDRWKEHFSELLNQPSEVDEAVLDRIPQYLEAGELAVQPTVAEIDKAILSLSNNRAPGEDGLPAEIFKHGGMELRNEIHRLFLKIWDEEKVPTELKNAKIVSIYKNKGSRSDCNNYRGIALLAVAGKMLTKILQMRIAIVLLDTAVTESQCGFRSGKGTCDMIFAARQLQEKCIEQQKSLYAVFIDLTKAFDTVNRDALWHVLRKKGFPQKIINIIKSLHTGMSGSVVVDGDTTSSFPISTGVKQGCVIGPTLFILYFDAMLQEALQNCTSGIYIKFRTDGSLFNLARLRAKTKVNHAIIQELLYADDCGIFAHSEEDIQILMDNFSRASKSFGLTVSIKKTEVLYQPSPNTRPTEQPCITVDNQPLKVTERFTYLGSSLSNDGQLDHEISSRIAKASAAFGRLNARVWSSHDIKLRTKLDVYKAVVLSTLLYAAETWTVYARHLGKLEAFQQRCLRKIMNIKWESFTSNLEVLQKAQMMSVENVIRKKQLKWSGHVTRMADSRIPKQLLYGELETGQRPLGRPRKRFRDELKVSLNKFEIDSLEEAVDRSKWRKAIHDGAEAAEQSRSDRIHQLRLRRKRNAVAAPTGITCPKCSRICANTAGLSAHMRLARNCRN